MSRRISRIGGGQTNRSVSDRLVATPRVTTARAATPNNSNDSFSPLTIQVRENKHKKEIKKGLSSSRTRCLPIVGSNSNIQISKQNETQYSPNLRQPRPLSSSALQREITARLSARLHSGRATTSFSRRQNRGSDIGRNLTSRKDRIRNMTAAIRPTSSRLSSSHNKRKSLYNQSLQTLQTGKHKSAFKVPVPKTFVPNNDSIYESESTAALDPSNSISTSPNPENSNEESSRSNISNNDIIKLNSISSLNQQSVNNVSAGLHIHGKNASKSDVKGIATLYVQDKTEMHKRNDQVNQWEIVHDKQNLLTSPKEAMRAFRKKLLSKNVNLLNAFKELRGASGSDDLLIDQKEFQNALHRSGIRVKPQLAKTLFAQLDPDGSGEIDYNEFATHMVSPLTPNNGAVAENTRMGAAKVRTMADLKAKRKQMMLASDMGAIDIDGDGVIDEYEIQLAKYLKDVKGKDLDGDGIVDEFEKLSAQRALGKQLMVDHLRGKFHGRLNLFGKSFRNKTDDVICASILKSPNFGYTMKVMAAKGQMVNLKSSNTMKHAIAPRGNKVAMKRWRHSFYLKPLHEKAKYRKDVLQQAKTKAAERARRSSAYEIFMKRHCGYYKMATSGFSYSRKKSF